jgi:Ser/Thr protein kinase RdoA (MazF antagonist)
MELDPSRVSDLLAGYCSVHPLDDAQRSAVPVCLRGRGLQMLAKRTQLGIADDGPVRQLTWLETHERLLYNAISTAVREAHD